MLLLVFTAGTDRYGVDASQILEIGPFVGLRQVRAAPPGFLGWCNFRGKVTPVIDLTWRLSGQACRPLLGTRLLLVEIPLDSGTPRPVLMAAEGITAAVRCDPESLQPSGIQLKSSPFLGSLVANGEGMIQLIDLTRILNADLQEALESGEGAPE